MQKFLTKYFSKVIVHTKVQIGILLFFTGLIIFDIVACTKVKTNILP